MNWLTMILAGRGNQRSQLPAWIASRRAQPPNAKPADGRDRRGTVHIQTVTPRDLAAAIGVYVVGAVGGRGATAA